MQLSQSYQFDTSLWLNIFNTGASALRSIDSYDKCGDHHNLLWNAYFLILELSQRGWWN